MDNVGTRFTEFMASSVDLRLGISRSASETNVRLFFLPMALKVGSWSFECIITLLIYFINCRKTAFTRK